MAVRDDFTAGEVLAAADLNDTFASKVPYAYGTATPSTTVDGFVWFDENSTPPLAKFWDGSAWQVFSGARATVSGTTGSPTTTTRSDGKTVYKWAAGDGTVTVSRAGFVDLLLVGGGGSGGVRNDNLGPGGGGGGGVLALTSAYLPVGTHTVTLGVGGAANTGVSGRTGNRGTYSRLGEFYVYGGGGGAYLSSALINTTTVGAIRNWSAATGGGGYGDSGTAHNGGFSLDGQGFAGGNGATYTGGGGGGAGAVGGNASGNSGNGGAGGAGLVNNFETLSNQTYGGGGGGAAGVGTVGAGGAGGGTSAVTTGASTAGTDGLGGGSGAAARSGATGSGKGGNGVIVLVIG